MASTQKPLPAGFLDAAQYHIPHLTPFPAFRLDPHAPEDWLEEENADTGLELAEFDFDEIATLY